MGSTRSVVASGTKKQWKDSLKNASRLLFFPPLFFSSRLTYPSVRTYVRGCTRRHAERPTHMTPAIIRYYVIVALSPGSG